MSLLLNAKIYITTQNNKKQFTKMSLVSFLLNDRLAHLHCSGCRGSRPAPPASYYEQVLGLRLLRFSPK